MDEPQKRNSKYKRTNFHRLIFILLCLIWIIILLIYHRYISMVFPVLIICLYSYHMITIGNVLPASMAIDKKEYEKAERLLKANLNPKWLSPMIQGLYWYTKGEIEMDFKNNNENAKLNFDQCILLGEDVLNAAALGYFGKAMICVNEKKYADALALLEKSETCKVNIELSLLIADAKQKILSNQFHNDVL